MRSPQSVEECLDYTVVETPFCWDHSSSREEIGQRIVQAGDMYRFYLCLVLLTPDEYLPGQEAKSCRLRSPLLVDVLDH